MGKILPASISQDERKFQTYYHYRQTPEQHKQNLKNAYDQWEAEVASRKGYISNDLIDELIRLEWVPDDDLIKEAIKARNRGKDTGRTVDEGRARYIYDRAFYLQCAWRDYHYSVNPFEPEKCHYRKKEVEHLPVPLPGDPPRVLQRDEDLVDYDPESAHDPGERKAGESEGEGGLGDSEKEEGELPE